MSTTPAEPHEPQRAEPLSLREGRRPLGVPHEGVPAHLENPLRSWLRGYLSRELQQRVALQLEVELAHQIFAVRTTAPPQELALHPGVDLLDVVDVAIQLDEDLAPQVQNIRQKLAGAPAAYNVGGERADQVADLGRLLDDANSVYRLDVDREGQARLVRRVDATVQAAAEEAIATAEPTAGDLLRRAWVAAYSRTPTPPAAYRDAVLAVETAAFPVISPKDKDATLGKVISHLRQAVDKWELELADDEGGRAVDDLRGMLSLLWRGEDRHGGNDYRDVTLAEARAAVHLAVLLVQWLTDKVLRRRDAAGTP